MPHPSCGSGWRAPGGHHSGIPRSFWTNFTFRLDIARIVCLESTYYYHAVDGNQFGLFQMSPSLVTSEGVTYPEYWGGTRRERPVWYQCRAGERYIANRYKTPAAAWEHEEDYGWY